MKILNVCKKYNDSIALDNVNIDFSKNEMVFILGQSGSGKTTLLNMIGGIDKPSSGSIFFDDIDICKLSNKQLDDYRNENVGFIFQNYNLLNELTVYENILLALKRTNEKENIEKIKEYFKMVDLDYLEFKDKKVYKCSGGERQRIAIVRALIKNPKIILCDEPTGALDTENGHLVMNILKELAQNRLVIVVTHDEELANTYADRIINLKDGKIVRDDILNDKNSVINDEIKFEKSKPFIRLLFKIGLYNYRLHPKRTFFVLISLVISMVLFIIALNIAFLKQKNMESSFIKNNELEIVKIEKTISEIDKYNTIANLNFDSLFVKQYITKVIPITNDDYNIIDNISTCLQVMFNEKSITMLSPSANSIYDLERLKLDYDNKDMAPSGYAYTNYDKLTTMNAIIGNYPKNSDEVLISESFFNLFKEYGYKDYQSNQLCVINDYSDLIGKSILLLDNNFMYNQKQVVGIYKNDLLKKDFKDNTTYSYNFYDAVFVTESYYNDLLLQNDYSVLLSVNNTSQELENILDYSYSLQANINQDGSFTSLRISDIDNGFQKIADMFYLASIFKGICNIIAIIFIVIALILMVNTFSIFISKQQKQLGILKTLGIRNKDVNMIYYLISITASIFVLILSMVISSILISIINSYFKTNFGLNFIGFNALVLLIALLVIVLSISVALAIPLIRLNHKTPIQIIKGKD